MDILIAIGSPLGLVAYVWLVVWVVNRTSRWPLRSYDSKAARRPNPLTGKHLQKPCTNAMPICFWAVHFLCKSLGLSYLQRKKSRTDQKLRKY